jgi:2-amino-4-hydroxy-6-hydroxymethyldihydropteridine diphosphokinase
MTSKADTPLLAYLGLGSNLGDREANLLEALKRLEATGLKVVALSRFFETPPAYVLDQPDFINACAAVEVSCPPHDLLKILLQIEVAMGRVRLIDKGPRVIDLDILLFGDVILDSEDLTIPHPAMLERLFVLEPLCDIGMDVLHPVKNATIGELLEVLRTDVESFD